MITQFNQLLALHQLLARETRNFGACWTWTNDVVNVFFMFFNFQAKKR